MPVRRTEALADALALICRSGVEVWPLEEGDMELARVLYEQHPKLGARDLCHLASCRRRGVREIMTFHKTRGLGKEGSEPSWDTYGRRCLEELGGGVSGRL